VGGYHHNINCPFPIGAVVYLGDVATKKRQLLNINGHPHDFKIL